MYINTNIAIFLVNLIAAFFIICMSNNDISLVMLAIVLAIINGYYLIATYRTNTIEPSGQLEGFSHHNIDIYIRGAVFSPERAYVKIGDTVTWKNMDTKPHQIRSELFNSGVIQPHYAFSYTFNQFGSYTYWDDLCNMYGSVYVEPDDYLASKNDFISP